MRTDRDILNMAARACVALESCGYITARDAAAKRMAYTLCRVVLLGMNGLDQTAPGSARTGKSEMTLTTSDIKARLRDEFKAVMREIKAAERGER